MINQNLPFLNSLNLLANKTYLTLYKAEKGKNISKSEIEELKKFFEILQLMYNTLNDPFINNSKRRNIAPLYSVLAATGIEKEGLSKLLTKLNNIINDETDGSHSILERIKQIADNIEKMITRETMESKDETFEELLFETH